MKRRNFLTRSAAGALGLGIAECSSLSVKRELSPHAFDKKAPKPVGTMPMAEIGKAGIRVSKFGFGSHMRKDIIPYEKEREWMIREAYDLGVNFFDLFVSTATRPMKRTGTSGISCSNARRRERYGRSASPSTIARL